MEDRREAEWFQQDRFWEVMQPVLFGERRWAATPDQVERTLALLDLPPGARVLDLCCGPGRCSLELARRGYRVTGVDRTRSYLDQARDRAAAQDLTIEWVECDMREFVRAEAFDAVINMFTSFGYFTDPADDSRVLDHVRQSLVPGGRVLLEMLGREVLARVFAPRAFHREEDGTILLEERRLCADWSWIENRWSVVRDGRIEEHRFGHRLYAGTELAAMLRACGFEEVTLFGSLAGAPYDHEAQRLVARARKPLVATQAPA